MQAGPTLANVSRSLAVLQAGARHRSGRVLGPISARPAADDDLTQPVAVDGKHFRVGDRRHVVRGVTYGTFRPRDDGERFPSTEVARRDFAAMADAGFNTVRTYTAPSDDIIDAAATSGVRLFAGLHTNDWRYLVGTSRREQRRQMDAAERHVREVARRWQGRPEIFALSLGNEVPADVVRWFGSRRVAASIARLAEVVKEEDPERLITYGNYPSAEYLALDTLDFLTFNVFLDDAHDLRAYLNRLHSLAEDRPLVLGEFGRHVGDGLDEEHQQAQLLDAQYEVALERGVAGAVVFAWTDEWHVGDAPVEGWRFGLTRTDRSPREALHIAKRWNARTVADLSVRWPRISVVVCAHNEEATIAECLTAATALDYPDFEVIVVDDGSSDQTAEIAESFAGVRTVRQRHAGLSAARNTGIDAATGEIVAYLDADAYPTPEWLRYLYLAFDRRDVGGAGGPNLPPPNDPDLAQLVAASPGGPAHVLVSDDRAEHVPGCNMAFWRSVLIEIGGFDPVYRAAGDDIDVCWKVLDRGWQIGFHPAAVVWHHRRGSVRTYLRQQRGYGRAEALVAARHPDRFTRLGSARWRGRIYSPERGRHPGQRIYRGPLGTAPFQSIYHRGSAAVDWAHQLGVPVGVGVLVAAAAVASVWWPAILVTAACVAALGGLFAYDVARASPRRGVHHRWRSRATVAALHLLQPLARWWGRTRHWQVAHRDVGSDPLPQFRRTAGGVLLGPATRPRAEIARAVQATLRTAGYGIGATTGWEDHDGSVSGSFLLAGRLITSEHPAGTLQLRIRRRWSRAGAILVPLVAAVCAWVSPSALIVVAGAVITDVAIGMWKLGPRARLALTGSLRGRAPSDRPLRTERGE